MVVGPGSTEFSICRTSMLHVLCWDGDDPDSSLLWVSECNGYDILRRHLFFSHPPSYVSTKFFMVQIFKELTLAHDHIISISILFKLYTYVSVCVGFAYVYVSVYLWRSESRELYFNILVTILRVLFWLLLYLMQEMRGGVSLEAFYVLFSQLCICCHW